MTHIRNTSGSLGSLASESETRDDVRSANKPRRRRVRGWRLLSLLAVALILLVGAIKITHLSPLTTSPGPPGWRTFREPKFGWTVEYPSRWHAQRIAEVYHGIYTPG